MNLSLRGYDGRDGIDGASYYRWKSSMTRVGFLYRDLAIFDRSEREINESTISKKKEIV